jgi:TetR/AcrR family tetracycline transcriptional repressor
VVSEPAAERAPVSRDAIVAAALALLAENGLDAVSFRRIAARLGVSGPTLYWHVENKRQLMDLMAEALLEGAGVTPSTPGDAPWWEWLREQAVRMFQALIATRDAPRVLAGNRPSEENLGDLERSLGVLVDGGLTPLDAQQTLFALGAYVLGSATEWQAEAERTRTTPACAPDEARALRLEALAAQPLLVAAFTEKVSLPHTATFEFGLDLLIDGLRTRYASER